MTAPRITLAIDNCFASKRWTRPDEWARIVADLGLRAIETSADTECDPLYGGPDYLASWVEEVEAAERKHGVEVVNMYSGHGTYATLGLAHTDERVRERMMREWLFPMIDVAARLDAGVGFFCHAFPQRILDDASVYSAEVNALHGRLAEIARYAGRRLSRPAGVEQMYTPHQYPWRIGDALDLMGSVSSAAGSPFYALLDVGHQSGQHRFLRPSPGAIRSSLGAAAGGQETWIGPPRADALRDRVRAGELAPEQAAERIEAIVGESVHLFADDRDSDPYAWLEAMGTRSPIVHLQQTDGRASRHLPFTREHNEAGIIEPGLVLEALSRSADRAHMESARAISPAGAPPADEPASNPSLPPQVDDIYLTIEVFAGTAEYPATIIDKLRRTVSYWRRWIPEDGAPLDELVARARSTRS